MTRKSNGFGRAPRFVPSVKRTDPYWGVSGRPQGGASLAPLERFYAQQSLPEAFRERRSTRRRAYIAYLDAKARGENPPVVLDPDYAGM